jgi:hypothetical protein
MRPFGPGWSGDAQLFWIVNQLGAELRLTFSAAVTGRYEVFVHFTKAPDYSLVGASLDGATWVAFNGYATAVSRDRAFLAMRDLTPGAHELLLKVAMKEGSSRGLNVGIDRIELAPVGAAAARPGAAAPTGAFGQVGAISDAARAPVVLESARPRIPVLHITSADVPQERIEGGRIAPLPMPERIAVVQQATSSSVKNAGEAVRLTAATPRVFRRAALGLSGGGFVFSDFADDGLIHVLPNGQMSIHVVMVEPKQPQLLDCGVYLQEPGDISLLATVNPGDESKQSVHNLSFPKGEQRLMSVFIPSFNSFTIFVKTTAQSGLRIHYCELTPFK